MKPKEIFNSRFANLIGYNITLYPFVFYIGVPTDDVRVHEMVHVWQIKNIGVFRFYSDYLWQYLRYWIKYGDQYLAYRAISYELEAYDIQRKFLSLPMNLKTDHLTSAILLLRGFPKT